MSEVVWVESKEELEVLLSTNPEVVIDFTAPSWCRPCQQFAPHFDAASKSSDMKFVAVDIDKAPWAVVDYGVMSVPTVMFYRDGGHFADVAKNPKNRKVVSFLAELNSLRSIPSER